MTNEGARLDVRTLPVPRIPARGAKGSIAFANAIRLQESFTARAERKALAWLAARLPPWVNSDHLTLLGFPAMILAGASYALVRANRVGLILASIFLALNWFGDSLDGTLARVRNRQRPRYGFYIDHVVDACGALFLFVGLGLSSYMSPAVAGVLLIAYLMLTIEVMLATHTLGTFTISYFKMGPTELRILLAIGTLVLLVHPTAVVFGRAFRLFDVGGVGSAIGLFVTLIVSAVRNTRTLYLAEPIPDERT